MKKTFLHKILFQNFIFIKILFLIFFPKEIFAQENNKINKKQMPKNLKKILKNAPDNLKVFYKNPKKYRFQAIYTPIIRKADNTPVLGKTQIFGVKNNEYFYPASVVKLPIALCALEKLKKINNPQINAQTPIAFEVGHKPQTAAQNDTTSQSGFASVGHYVEKIFVTSDNDASNRLYEFLGQKYLNQNLHQKGYKNFCVTHRLASPQYSIAENRYTNPMYFFEPIISKNPDELSELRKTNLNEIKASDLNPELNSKKVNSKKEVNIGVNNSEKNILYSQKEEHNTDNFFHKAKNSLIGKSYMSGEKEVKNPLSFKERNFFPLTDMHQMLKTVFFPEFCPKKSIFDIRNEDLTLVKNAMRLLPRQSVVKEYQKLPDHYAKYFFKDLKDDEKIPEHLVIYNKVGMAFGFLVENAYMINEKTKEECMLSVCMYVNENEILNDDKYEYDSLGFPLLVYLRKAFLEW